MNYNPYPQTYITLEDLIKRHRDLVQRYSQSQNAREKVDLIGERLDLMNEVLTVLDVVELSGLECSNVVN